MLSGCVSFFSDLVLLFPYLEYFVYYKLFHIFASQTLMNAFSLIRGYDYKLVRLKAEASTKRLGLFVVWSYVLLHTAESAVGEGFVYLWLSEVFFYGLLLIFVLESKNWEKEIESLIKAVVPALYCEKLISLSNKFLFARSILLLSFGVVAYLFFYVVRWLQDLEIFKTLSAQLFRERVKKAASPASSGVVNQNVIDYRQLFLEQPVEVTTKSQQKVLEDVDTYVQSWVQQKETRKNFAILGSSGVGKTYLLDLIEKKVSEHTTCMRWAPKSRHQANQFLDELESAVGQASEQPQLFLVDGLQMLFLAKVGGFKQVRRFFNLIDSCPDSISWLVNIDSNTWNYLNAILNKTRYFSRLFKLEKWTETELKEYILRRHEVTEYRLSFNAILIAMKSDNFYEDKKYVEEKYFRVLWEEAQGNPSVAQELWLASLQKGSSNKSLNVGIPHSRFESIAGLPNDFYFVLASLVRHVEMSLRDLADVNDTDVDIVRNAIEYCEDQGLVVKNGAMVSLSPLWRNNVLSTLYGKNYIYGK